jgi:hypothetical protein
MRQQKRRVGRSVKHSVPCEERRREYRRFPNLLRRTLKGAAGRTHVCTVRVQIPYDFRDNCVVGVSHLKRDPPIGEAGLGPNAVTSDNLRDTRRRSLQAHSILQRLETGS